MEIKLPSNRNFSMDEKQKAARPAAMKPVLAPYGEVKPTIKFRLLARRGNVFVPLPVNQVALFYIHSRLTFAIDFSGNKYRVDYNLKHLDSIIDSQLFFHISKSMMVHVDAIKEFSRIEFGKLSVQLQPAHLVKEKIIISQHQAPRFKKWIAACGDV